MCIANDVEKYFSIMRLIWPQILSHIESSYKMSLLSIYDKKRTSQ